MHYVRVIAYETKAKLRDMLGVNIGITPRSDGKLHLQDLQTRVGSKLLFAGHDSTRIFVRCVQQIQACLSCCQHVTAQPLS